MARRGGFHPLYLFYKNSVDFFPPRIFSLQIFLLDAGELRLLGYAYKHGVKGQSRWELFASVGALRLRVDGAGPKQTQYNKYLFSSLLLFLFPHILHPAPALLISCP